MKYLLNIGLMLFFISGFAVEVKREKVYSNSMQKDLSIIVVSPERVKNKLYNTVYILHGYSGNAERTLVKDLPNVSILAEQMQTIIVLVDGNYNSWYVDSPIKKDSQYQTFIGKELVDYIDITYPTKNNKQHRGIIGWSMGGYGAVNIGVAYQEIFGIVGSVCGALDFDDFGDDYKNYQIDKVLGPLNSLKDKYKTRGKIQQMKDSKQYYIFDCGTEDPFLDLNRRFHQELVQNRIQHSYIEQLGKHDTTYWSEALSNQLVLFLAYFKQQ